MPLLLQCVLITHSDYQSSDPLLACSAAGPMKLRASASKPGSARSSAVFCWSSGCRKSSPTSPDSATARRGAVGEAAAVAAAAGGAGGAGGAAMPALDAWRGQGLDG